MRNDLSAFAALVGKVLEELEDGTWVLDGARHGRFYLRWPDLNGSLLVLSLKGERAVIYGSTDAAPDVWWVEWPRITVATSRGPEVVAREIERRLLHRYRKTLAEALEAQRQHDATQSTMQQQADELAALLRGKVSHGFHSTEPPRLYACQYGPDGVRSRLDLRIEKRSHRLGLSLPHDQAVAVVELLVGLWEAGCDQSCRTG